MDKRMREIKCRDCGLPYDDFGHDTFLPREQWLSILSSDEKEFNKKFSLVLCANCMVRRASRMNEIVGIEMRLQTYDDMRIELVLEKIRKLLSRVRFKFNL